jgi:hypothetical protein
VANPAKLASSYFNIDVFLVGFFPELFIRNNSRPPNSRDKIDKVKQSRYTPWRRLGEEEA